MSDNKEIIIGNLYNLFDHIYTAKNSSDLSADFLKRIKSSINAHVMEFSEEELKHIWRSFRILFYIFNKQKKLLELKDVYADRVMEVESYRHALLKLNRSFKKANSILRETRKKCRERKINKIMKTLWKFLCELLEKIRPDIKIG